MIRRKRELPVTVDAVRLLTKKDVGSLLGVSYRYAEWLIVQWDVRMIPVGKSLRVPYWELLRAQKAAVENHNSAMLSIIEGGSK